jgi:hypothetical protein
VVGRVAETFREISLRAAVGNGRNLLGLHDETIVPPSLPAPAPMSMIQSLAAATDNVLLHDDDRVSGFDELSKLDLHPR